MRLVQSADAGKAKIVSLADRWATWIVITALSSAALTWLMTGEILRAVTILVVFCPCTLVLATPTTIMAAIGNATKHGFLVREGDVLERLADVSKIAFDKTGTLTYGTPEVEAVCAVLPHWPRPALYALAAGAELRSEHPLGKAVVRGYRKAGGPAPAQPEAFAMLPARGVTATVAGVHVAAGTQALLDQQGAEAPPDVERHAAVYTARGCTVIYLALNGDAAGFIALADTLRPDAAEVIRRVKTRCPSPVLLTGDHEEAARTIAGQLGIEEFRAGCLPENKQEWIGTSQQQGRQMCMIGDGVNDAPTLKKAHMSIAMGGVGSDIAAGAAESPL